MHTPGPWTIRQSMLCNGRDIMVETSGIMVGTARARSSRHITQGECDANARLIAAAPDLLKALEYILSYDDTVEGADAAQVAIAKARGE